MLKIYFGILPLQESIRKYGNPQFKSHLIWLCGYPLYYLIMDYFAYNDAVESCNFALIKNLNYSYLIGSFTPASSNPLKRSLQLSHTPQALFSF